MGSGIKGFIITAEKEKDRADNVARIRQQLPQVEIMHAVYPSDIHLPFLRRLIQKSAERTGEALNPGEIGILLSNRRVWREICKRAGNDQDHFLVLESDSRILDEGMLKNYFHKIGNYDIFFWGAWSGNMQLHRSTIHKENNHTIGEPLLKTVYGAYGYSLNRKAAHLLLQRTGKISWPVDQYKRFFSRTELAVGGIVPEVVSHWDTDSTIGHAGVIQWQRTIKLKMLWVRNWLICLFT